MSAPDVTGYVDLTLLDKTPQDLVDGAVAQAATTMTDWVPAEGQTEMAIIEAMAVIVAEAIFAVNRIPGTVTEVLLRLFDFDRDDGASATGAVQFNLADITGYFIPAGSLLTVPVTGLVDPVLIETLSDLTVPGGSASGIAAVGTSDHTSVANGTPAGTPCAVVSSLPLVDSAVVTTALVDGRDVEDARAFLDRAIGYLRTLSSTLVRASDFEAASEAVPGIGRAFAIDAYNPAVGPVGSNPGHITVAALDDNGVALSAPAQAALLAILTSRASGDLGVHTANPTITSQAVTATVKQIVGYDPTDVQNSAIAAVQAWLDPAVWPWSGTIRRNTLIAVLSEVAGVDYVVSITTPATDTTITGAAPLANAGTVTITVT